MPERIIELENGLIVDEDTGEILAEDLAEGMTTLEALQREWSDAKAQEEAWKRRGDAARRALQKYIEDHDGERAVTRFAKSSWVAPGIIRKAPAENVTRAIASEDLTEGMAYDLLVEAAKELDHTVVEDWLARHDLSRIKPLLIDERPRAGYVRTTIVAKVAPEQGSE